MTTTAPAVERPAPTTVIEALARVMEDLPGIGKDEKSPQGYNYRGVEAITAHVQPLFGRYGVVIVPRVLNRTTVDLVVNGKPWTEEQMEVLYRAYGPAHGKVRQRRIPVHDPDTGLVTGAVEIDEVVDDSIEIGPLVGLGRDNSDKGANKAMTQAWKYALIQTLAIGDRKDDGDDCPAPQADPRREKATPQGLLADRIRDLPEPARAQVRDWVSSQGWPKVPREWDDQQFAHIATYVSNLEASIAAETPQEPPKRLGRAEQQKILRAAAKLPADVLSVLIYGVSDGAGDTVADVPADRAEMLLGFVADAEGGKNPSNYAEVAERWAAWKDAQGQEATK